MGNFIRIEGDHSSYHAGSAAAFSGLVRIARGNGWTVVNSHDNFDVLVVNGEGSMHHGSRGFHQKMGLLAQAVGDGKPAYLVNSVWQSNPSDYDDVLRALAGIVVRENSSRDDLLDRHGISAKVLPDASMFAPLPFFTLRKNFRGKPVQTDFYFSKDKRFGRADEMFPQARYLRFRKMSWGRAVASLRTAGYLVTGRHHGVFAACKARVPFVASEGNTHKIKGLIATAGVNIPIANDPSEIAGILPLIPALGAEYTKLFDWLEAQDYLSMLPQSGRLRA